MWGSNKYGLLGDGNDVDYQNPKEILSDVKSVSLGIDCAAAIKMTAPCGCGDVIHTTNFQTK